MKRFSLVAVGAMAGAAIGLSGVSAQAEETLNVLTAGSQNMVDYVTDYLAPLFESQNPGVKVVVAGTGPGASGSQKIFEKLEAQKQAGKDAWDVDVAVVHQQ
ncbi:MAG: extracellular solute-binding protein, partial [Alphaproteobacteria bacterium]